jgi:hypothetical protein
MPQPTPIAPSTLSPKTQQRIAAGRRKFLLRPRAEKKVQRYVITDAKGLELGEAAGKTRPEALVALVKMDPEQLPISRAQAQRMVDRRQIRFERVA